MKIHKKMLVAGLILIMLLAISGCGRKNINQSFLRQHAA